VAFGLRMRRLPGDEIRRRVLGMLERVGLAGLDRRYPRQLSGGAGLHVSRVSGDFVRRLPGAGRLPLSTILGRRYARAISGLLGRRTARA